MGRYELENAKRDFDKAGKTYAAALLKFEEAKIVYQAAIDARIAEIKRKPGQNGE